VILVDSSVWIDYFNGRATPQTQALDGLLGAEPLLVGDIILAEVLQGFRRDADFEQALQALQCFEQVGLITPAMAVQSARNYRTLRNKGLSVGKTVDCIIATWCIENGCQLLHNDADFIPFEDLGLAVVHS
jgi:hypothetical protein